MADLDTLLELLLRIESVLDKSEERGIPNQIPEGINPAPLGSTFDKRFIPPTLSAAEKKRVTEIAEIFHNVLLPKDEAKEAKRPGIISQRESSEQLLNLFTQRDIRAKDGGIGGGIMSIAASLLGGIGGTGAAAAIASSALPILAGFVGAGILAIAGGFTFQLIMEGLKKAKDIDWDAVGRAGDTLIKGIGGLVGVLQTFIGFLIDKGLDVIDKMFDIWRKNIEQIAISIGTLGKSFKEYKDVDWQDIGKGMATLFSALLTVTLFGPSIAVLGTIGAFISILSGVGLNLIGNGLKLFAIGLEDMLSTIDKYANVDVKEFSKGLHLLFTTMVALAAMGVTAPINAIGAVIAQIGGWGLEGLGDGMIAIGKAFHPIADGLERLQDLDAEQLKNIGFSLGSIADGLFKYGTSTLLSSIAIGLAELFGGTGIDGLIRFTNSGRDLSIAAGALMRMNNSLNALRHTGLRDIAKDLEKINKSVNKLDIGKLEKLSGMRVNMHDIATEQLHRYLVTGKSNAESGNGLISLTKDILEENRKQVRTLQDIKIVISNLRTNDNTRGFFDAEPPTAPDRGSINPRNGLFGAGMTITQ